MSTFFLVLCATALAVTSIVHSALGEIYLLKPLLAGSKGILGSRLARFVFRFAWHLTSLSWLVIAVILLALEFRPEHALRCVLTVTGIAFTAAGIFDAIGSRGRHLGWPLLMAIGITSLLAMATAS